MECIKLSDDTDFKDGDDGNSNLSMVSITKADNGYILVWCYDQGEDRTEVAKSKLEALELLKRGI